VRLKYRQVAEKTRVLKKGNVLFATDLAVKAILARHCQKGKSIIVTTEK